MTDFRIENYDIGGNNAIANDGKLTGSEAKKAQKDGWTVWDGYSSNDLQPENTKVKKQEAKKEAKKEYIDVEIFDKGGKNAIAGDGKLTGDEIVRANRAGYKRVYEGDTQKELDESSYKGLRDTRDLTFGITRSVSNKTPNKLAQGLAMCADALLFAFEFDIDMIRAVTGLREDY